MHQNLKKLQRFSKEYIIRYADYINWDEASLLANIEDLPFDFINDYADQWNWRIIVQTHVLSEKFLIRFESYLDEHLVLNFQGIHENYLKKVRSKFSDFEIFYYRFTCHFSYKLIKKFRKEWMITLNIKTEKTIIQWLKRKWNQLKTSFH